MTEDWQSTAFSSRHVHNRGSKNSKAAAAVDVKKLFGTYTISCPAAAKLASSSSSTSNAQKYEGKLEIYCLNEEQNAVFGELVLPDVLHADGVVLAGSRKVLRDVVRGLEEEEDGEEGDGDGESDGAASSESASSGEEEGEEEAFEQNPAKARKGKIFEKNSFRSLKFWVRWQGELSASAIALANETVSGWSEDGGYWIWSGSQGDHFSGTISCRDLEWKNVKIEGWKKKPAGARDYQIRWRAEAETQAE